MAIIKKEQHIYAGKGPLDAKSLIRTYAELTKVDTWNVTISNVVDDEIVTNTVFAAYNGMIVAVWLNKTDTSKNGLYFLFDPQVTSALQKPDVTKEANWHRLDNAGDISDIKSRLTALENNSGGMLNITLISGGNASS